MNPAKVSHDLDLEYPEIMLGKVLFNPLFQVVSQGPVDSSARRVLPVTIRSNLAGFSAAIDSLSLAARSKKSFDVRSDYPTHAILLKTSQHQSPWHGFQ